MVRGIASPLPPPRLGGACIHGAASVHDGGDACEWVCAYVCVRPSGAVEDPSSKKRAMVKDEEGGGRGEEKATQRRRVGE